ncbi:MAG TPA: A/G-specific adenine glycosylase [Terriglobales bacterium]|nr:A/G-specific adenine glycosylase [Terriglobales bacterium]
MSLFSDTAIKKLFRRQLLRWYDANARDLPWRRDRDPYRVWLSEVMLQQTRVAAVIEHYHRFLQRFPTIEKLAAAREASVLAVWSGLGYYRRARMLHTAAKKIVSERGGTFPGSSAELKTLPGIGRYTAAAIASIAFNEPIAVVDGNVERVLQRVAGERLEKEKIWEMAQRLVSPQRPGDSDQAIMELGATICLPRQPKCLACPVVELCATRGELPAPEKYGRQMKREIHYALDCLNGSVFLVQRPNQASLMGGMWELPEIKIEKQIPPGLTPTRNDKNKRIGKNEDAQKISNSFDPAREKRDSSWLTLRHSITVTDYVVRVKRGMVPEGMAGKWVDRSKLTKLPLTGLARKILRKAEII